MPINRTECPECGAGLKSAAGFKVGQTIACPKCETYFQVPAPDEDEAPPPPKTRSLAKTAPLTTKKMAVKPAAVDDDDEKAAKTEKLRNRDDDDRPKKKRRDDDEDDDRPKKKKKKKKRDEEDEGGFSYSKSWIRVAVLGVLLTVLGVLGYMLYEKNKKEKQPDAPAAKQEEDDPSKPISEEQKRAAIERANRAREANKGKGVQPLPNPEPPPTVENLKKKLLGTWVAKDGGTTHTLVYRDDGTFTYTRSGEDDPIEGEWTADELLTGPGVIPGLRVTRRWTSQVGDAMQKNTQRIPAQFVGPRLVDHALPDIENDRRFSFDKAKAKS